MLHKSDGTGALGGARMRWWTWCTRLALLVSWAAVAAASEPALTARAAIVVDAETGATLWEDNADAQLPPASTTKVLTAILALESGRLDDWFVVSPYAAATPPSKLGLRAGQRLQLSDLLYAVLLKSANDASTVVAEGLAGTEERFAARMTARAHALGAVSSRFENAHGLHAPGHWSTARDLARLFRHALRLPEFREILATQTARVRIHGVSARSANVRSHNRLLTGWTYPVIGKTGYTRPAKRCFVGSAADGEREVVIAVLGSSDLWSDARQLVAYGFGEDPASVVNSPNPPLESARRKPEVQGARVAGRAGGRPGASPHATRRTATAVASAASARGTAARRPVGVASVQRRRNRQAVEGDRDEESRSASRYAVQLGPFATRDAVRSARVALLRRGFQTVPVGSSIRVGTFPNRRDADRLAGKLRGSGYRPVVVALR